MSRWCRLEPLIYSEDLRLRSAANEDPILSKLRLFNPLLDEGPNDRDS